MEPNLARSGGNPGARTIAAKLRQEHANEMLELMAIARVFERVVTHNFTKLDGGGRLATTDAKRRLNEFFEKCNKKEERKRPWTKPQN